MDDEVAKLKQILLREVVAFSRRDRAVWRKPIIEFLGELRRSNARAVLFGGTLRALLTARLFAGRPGRPRDVDVVVSGTPLDDLEKRFRTVLNRRTRFGGLQLKAGRLQVDVWPVADTWAFKHDQVKEVGFADLPSTTTFNLEAIAVEAWPTSGRSRGLFSGDDQFFEGILSRTLELNRSDSPFPELTAVRGLVMASELGFGIGPRFAQYVREVGRSLTAERLEQVQYSHYGHRRLEGRTLKVLIASILLAPSNGRRISLPAVGQLPLWEDGSEVASSRVSVQFLGPAERSVSIQTAPQKRQR